MCREHFGHLSRVAVFVNTCIGHVNRVAVVAAEGQIDIPVVICEFRVVKDVMNIRLVAFRLVICAVGSFGRLRGKGRKWYG